MPHAKISEAHVKPKSKWCTRCSLSATQKWGVLERFSADEGFEGGYDWNSLALVFLEEKMPEVSGLRAKTGN